MAYRATSFAPGEWYHCYSRSIDRGVVFKEKRDYERFLETLYLSNGANSIRRHDLSRVEHSDFFLMQTEAPLVGIGAYCLMPNHFHLLIKEKSEGGISKFMHRVGTSFTKYYNLKNDRVGNIFIKPFRSKHIDDDVYYKRVTQYIHLNSAELFEPHWKKGVVRNFPLLEKKMLDYPYSSLPDYHGASRPSGKLLDTEETEMLMDLPSFSSVLEEAAAYYANLSPSVAWR